MQTLKRSIPAALAVAALSLLPIASASASPFIAPWLLGRHVIGAVVGLATLPLAIASAAGQAEGPYPRVRRTAVARAMASRPAIIRLRRSITRRGRRTTRDRRLTTGHRRITLGLASTGRRAVTPRRARATLPHTVPTSPPARAVSVIAVGEGGASAPLKARRGRGGRPSRSDALQLRERILEVATEVFLSAGYGSTTIEAVAARAGISKRTFYHRFNDKADLFAAVVHRIIERLRPPPEVPLLEGATLHDVLRRLARLILTAALQPQAIALHRLVTAESARFPELIRAVSAESATKEAKALIGNLLVREIRDPRFTVARRSFAAEQFLHMVVAQPQRRAMGLGTPMSAGELDAWAEDVVALFLNGCRGWGAATSHQER